MNSVRRSLLAALLLWNAAAGAVEFKKTEDCVPGTRVTDRQGRTGVIAQVDNGLCKVEFADGTHRSYLFWMLRAAGADKAAAAALETGKYACYSAGNYLFMDVWIDAGGRYRSGDGKGGYTLAPDGGIVFGDGPLKSARAKLLEGPRIGLNLDGADFYNVSCSLKRP